MNTQAHALINLAILGSGARPRTIAAILFGSILPDIQIAGFYAIEKLVHGTPESLIWSKRYFEVHESFDWLNSIPLAALGAGVFHLLKWPVWRGLCGGLLLHCLLDFPLHNDDAHRHFLPLSTWRFESPLSYWDPAHYGVQMMLVEVTAVAIASVVLWRRWPTRPTGYGLTVVWSLYLVMGAAIAWMVAGR